MENTRHWSLISKYVSTEESVNKNNLTQVGISF